MPTETTIQLYAVTATKITNEKFNYNNHPFPGHADKDFAFAHNGVLYNDSTLRKEKHLSPTHIETDSYVAVQLIEQQGRLDFDSLKSMGEDVQGNFTFTVLDEENSLYIVKGSSPMSLIHFKAMGLYVYASTESIMKNALKKLFLNKFFYERIDTVDGDIIRIDCNGILSRSEFDTHRDFKFGGWYDDYDMYYTMHEQLLLDMCGCFGVDEDDVIMLLDYGYSADEIEAMLMDYDMISETVNAVKNMEEPYTLCG